MRSLIMVMIILIFLPATAKEEWLCTEQSSQRIGDSFNSCGVGIGADENAARTKALDNAKTEFLKICESSDDCKGQQVSAVPGRTTCEKTNEGYKCYRLVIFSVSPQLSDKRSVASETVRRSRIVLRKGMSKQELVSKFGSPENVVHGTELGTGKRYLQIFYRSTYCAHVGSSCYVILKDDRVESFEQFNPQFTDDMD